MSHSRPAGSALVLRGLAVQCTPGTLAGLRIGAEARLATSLVVREDSLTLYGFADDDEKHLFELLQTASGVGPRLAQAALAVLPPDQIRKALANADIARQMFVSEATVKTHLNRAMAKLGLSSRAQVVAAAYEADIFYIDERGYLEMDDGAFVDLAVRLNPDVDYWK